ncbi:hypothetical protein MTBBW1_440011 [Desulfamplus magnetovallimortis]|uniref:Uncharacterized protein n=1 Tax=Desulfamplus magnetovallimortis TaxID=1246637 RepID=A0A1W1HH84_9BACT|nr:hypothetical protein MTBBW1_440011 [Desulfamplus magnetovallimortis]
MADTHLPQRSMKVLRSLESRGLSYKRTWLMTATIEGMKVILKQPVTETFI